MIQVIKVTQVVQVVWVVRVARTTSLDDMHSENIWFSWKKPSKYREKLICHACDGGRTDGRKVENRAVFCWTRNRNNNSEDMALFSEKLAIFKQIFEKYVTYFSKQEFLGKYEIRRVIFRVEICHDRRSCKICAGCVNFP